MPIKSKQGDIIITPEEQDQKSCEHFQEIRNQREPPLPLDYEDAPKIGSGRYRFRGDKEEKVGIAKQTLKINNAPVMVDIK